jgi:hypothetical protein
VRAGTTSEWNPPSEGEQCLLLCCSGDPATGFVLLGIPSDQFPPPSDSLDEHVRRYPDGATITYNHATGALSAVGIKTALLQAANKVTVDCPLTELTGDVHIMGKLTVDGEALFKSLLTYMAGMSGQAARPARLLFVATSSMSAHSPYRRCLHIGFHPARQPPPPGQSGRHDIGTEMTRYRGLSSKTGQTLTDDAHISASMENILTTPQGQPPCPARVRQRPTGHDRQATKRQDAHAVHGRQRHCTGALGTPRGHQQSADAGGYRRASRRAGH